MLTHLHPSLETAHSVESALDKLLELEGYAVCPPRFHVRTKKGRPVMYLVLEDRVVVLEASAGRPVPADLIWS